MLPFGVKFIAGPYLSPTRPQPSAARHFTTGPTLHRAGYTKSEEYTTLLHHWHQTVQVRLCLVTAPFNSDGVGVGGMLAIFCTLVRLFFELWAVAGSSSSCDSEVLRHRGSSSSNMPSVFPAPVLRVFADVCCGVHAI